MYVKVLLKLKDWELYGLYISEVEQGPSEVCLPQVGEISV